MDSSWGFKNGSASVNQLTLTKYKIKNIIISIDAEKSFRQDSTSFFDKSCQQGGYRRTSIKKTKAIYHKPTANIIVVKC